MTPGKRCPFCFHLFSGQLWFQCAGGTGPNGLTCSMQADDGRWQELGFSGIDRPVFPPSGAANSRQMVCPTCRTVTAIRACPCCHSPLPQGFDASGTALIAVVGARGCGKSVYLGVLAENSRVRLPGHRHRSRQQHLNDTFSYRSLPDATALPDGSIVEWVGTPHSEGRVDKTFLTFVDVPAHAMSDVADVGCLHEADAVIEVVDSTSFESVRMSLDPQAYFPYGDHGSVLEAQHALTDTLRQVHPSGVRSRIDIPVAVAVAKADALERTTKAGQYLANYLSENADAGQAAGDLIDEYVRALLHREWGAEELDRHIGVNYARSRFFAVSSIGRQPEVDDEGRGRYPEAGIRPWAVEEPVKWILKELGLVS